MTAQRKNQLPLPDMMRAIRQNQPGGELVVESIPVPEPGSGEVLVKMEASPINPSDLALLKGGYLKRNYPFTPGLEGSGKVIKSGGGFLAGLRVGKRVACTPDPEGNGTWAEYMTTSVMRTVPLPATISYVEGATLLVNPMTAMALIHIARKEGHKAIVNNAAASALGKMLIRLTSRYRIPLINIVRRGEQVAQLKQMGATHVLNSGSSSFEPDLTRLADQLEATLFLDAVAGEQTSLLLRAAPRGATLIIYARLSSDPMALDPGNLIREEKQMMGFQLGNWLNTKSIPFKLRFIGRVKKALSHSLTTTLNRTLPMEEVKEAISLYKEEMSAGKIILTMGESTPHDPSS